MSKIHLWIILISAWLSSFWQEVIPKVSWKNRRYKKVNWQFINFKRLSSFYSNSLCTVYLKGMRWYEDMKNRMNQSPQHCYNTVKLIIAEKWLRAFWSNVAQSMVRIRELISEVIQLMLPNNFSPVTALQAWICQWWVLIADIVRAWSWNKSKTIKLTWMECCSILYPFWLWLDCFSTWNCSSTSI